ncbi:DNA primase [Sphingomonas sp. PAMC 26621]|uniref:DNA primase n=1 Tax=Sphingomonas sp. PAMC 26621 TaxID=1112213 RepID=UPI00028954B5|nr:DNA primase [Sphingomonas sp. PAMC 26621]
MALTTQFLDDLRSRITLSDVVGRTLKLDRAGREFRACCPFHQEQTPSFYVNDDKGFYHCFGCGAHGDAIRWLTDKSGLGFIDAVRTLAEDAGVIVPAPSPDVERRENEASNAADVLAKAAAWYAAELVGDAKTTELLTKRGVGAETIARFELGVAPARKSIAASGVPPKTLETHGLMMEATEGRDAGLWRDRFRQRIMIPIHDTRGRMIGFGGRAIGDAEPKYLNSPDSTVFNKGEVLFNLHRAAPAARSARRLIIGEGFFDVIALDRVGILEGVAPMGTALTERQLERAWRATERPILLFDGDAPGQKAALRACGRALPFAGPGRSLTIAMLPDGHDPDTLVNAAGSIEEGRAAIEHVLSAAQPMDAWLWETLLAAAEVDGPEGRAGLWAQLATMAGTVRDDETRAHYLSAWRARFDAEFPPLPPGMTEDDMLPHGRVADLSIMGEADRARVRRVVQLRLSRTPNTVGDDPKQAGRFAFKLGGMIASGLIDPFMAMAAAVVVLGEGRVAKWNGAEGRNLRRSFEAGMAKGYDVAPMLLDRRCAMFNRTDKGNSERWIARYGEDYLYTTSKGWLGWDGRRYRVLNQEKDTTPAEVLASVVATIEAIQREADFVRDTGWAEWVEISEKLLLDETFQDPRRPHGMDRWQGGGKKTELLSDKLAGWANASEAAGRINCISGLVKRDVTVELSTFDTDPLLLNCTNGTLRFIRGGEGSSSRVELQPHNRADRLTKVTACAYEPEAPAPLFQPLIEWAQPDSKRRRYLRQWMGYNLTGETSEQIFHVWWGPSAANGKSTVSNVCRDAVGDYGAMTKAETFLEVGAKKGADAASPGLAVLPSIRLLVSGEPPKDAKVDEALINTVTGGDEMMARDNFRSFFWFTPAFKWTLSCNKLPPIPQGTEGIWRRIKVVLWESHLEEHEKDRSLPRKLRDEYSGILAWMVRGALDWMDNGFVEPDSVRDATAEFKADSDPATRFLRACTEPDEQGSVQSSTLYAVFLAWAKAAGETEWSQKGFSGALKSKLTKKASNGMHWLGIKLTREAHDFVDSEGNVRQQTDSGRAASPAIYDDDDLPP